MATKVQRGLWLQPGDVGEATVSPMRRVDGRWVVVARDRRVKPEAWRARVFYRGWDGSAGEVSARRATKQAATVAAQQAARDRMAVADTATNVTGSVSLSVAVSQWLDDLARTDSGLFPGPSRHTGVPMSGPSLESPATLGGGWSLRWILPSST